MIDVDSFVSKYELQTHPLNQSAKDGLKQLLGFALSDSDISGDRRHLSYFLATIRHECAGTWRPIEEFGKGAGKAYGVPQWVADTDGIPRQVAYYGRGYVQITWERNYLLLGSRIGLVDKLVIHPELALDPQIAYNIASVGMRQGLFTGVSLSRFIHDDICDYVSARKVINGLDQADKIAGYARLFEGLLSE